jgi:HSP20 family protein
MAKRSLIPWRRERDIARASDPFRALRWEMDDLFRRFFGERELVPFGEGEGFVPAVDVAETDKEVRVTAELPGMEEKDIDLSLTDDTLTVKGEKKTEREEKSAGGYYAERTYGAFERTVMLPCEVDSAKAKASYSKGVLTVTLPKSPSAAKKSKKITVSSA